MRQNGPWHALRPDGALLVAAALLVGPSGAQDAGSEVAGEVGSPAAAGSIPSTAAVVGGVVGGLGALSLILGAVLIIAVGSLYGWRWMSFCRSVWVAEVRLPTRGDQGGEDEQSLAEMGRQQQRGKLPSIVTSRLEPSGSESTQGVGGEGGTPAAANGTATQTGRQPGTPRGTGAASAAVAAAAGDGSTPPLSPLAAEAADTFWKDCLIPADKICILRRKDGSPWKLGGGAFGQVGAGAAGQVPPSRGTC